MKNPFLLVFILLISISCNFQEQLSKEVIFWDWVKQHKIELEKFILSEQRDYSIYNELSEEMKKYHSELIPEMTLTEKDEIVLIISPDGVLNGVAPTEKLFDAKPQLDNWVIKKFRQATDEITLNYDGVEYPSNDIQIIATVDKVRKKVDVKIFIQNMDIDKERYQSLAFLYLDHILGEYNTITRVGYIDFIHLAKGKNIENSRSILELRKLIENSFPN